METIEEYLRSILGERKIPLAYVVRKEADVPPLAPPVVYTTIQEEMISRARHLKAVNRQVAQLAKQMSKTGMAGDDDTADSTASAESSDCDGKCSGGNRNNRSLTRQKKVSINDPKK